MEGGLRGGRCFGDGDPLLAGYHDREWGRPVTTERGLYERLCLECFQAGLSWILVLRRREALREAFAGFDPDAVAAFAEDDVTRILAAPGVIRNRAKVAASVGNARAVLELRRSGRSLVELVWAFRPEPGVVRSPAGSDWKELPSATEASAALSREFRRCGIRFLGPTAAYALMQAAGLVNDHFAGCAVRAEVQREQEEAAAALGRPGAPAGGGGWAP